MKRAARKPKSQKGRLSLGGSRVVAARLVRLEAEVLAGTRDASTLFLIPRELVKAATLVFPKDPYGPPEPW